MTPLAVRPVSLALFLFLLFGAATAEKGCGGCWCAPGNGTCPTSWKPGIYNATFIAAYSRQTARNPLQLEADCNPYTNASCVTYPTQELVNSTSAVCARVYDTPCERYSLRTFSSEEAALKSGAVLTHKRACGVCSTTQDVGVYLRIPDMTKKGKICGLEAALSTKLGVECFEKLGFTSPCATIWTYDAQYDLKHCGEICLEELFAPDNGPPPFCKINKCLACDEDKAGPLFKAFAGATRRRSGILSTIVRPCPSVAHIDQRLCGDE
jgi:hypothetical protein